MESAWLNSWKFSATFPFNLMIIREVNYLSGSLKRLHYYVHSTLLHSCKMILEVHDQGWSRNTKVHTQHTSIQINIQTNLQIQCGTVFHNVLNAPFLCFCHRMGECSCTVAKPILQRTSPIWGLTLTDQVQPSGFVVCVWRVLQYAWALISLHTHPQALHKQNTDALSNF